MAYFDDVKFIDCEIIPHCQAVMNQRFTTGWSVEFILEGRMSFGIDGGSQTVLESPAVFWHTPDHTYQYGAIDAEGWHHHWVLMNGQRARRLVEEGFSRLSEDGYLHVTQAAQAREIFHSAIKAIKSGGDLEHGEAVVLLERLLCLLQAESAQKTPPTPYSAGIAKLAGRITEGKEPDFCFEAEARKLGLSYSRFRHLFKAQLGCAPHELLLQARMRLAARLLRDRSLGIKQVAQAVGCGDIAQFSKLFKKKVGIPPRAYRNALP